MNQTQAESSLVKRKGSFSLRFLVPTLLVACGIVLLASGIDIRDTQQWLRSLGIWAPFAFIFIAIALMSVLLPKTAISVTAGVLFGTTTGSVLMVIIAVTAATTNYCIGRWWLKDSIDQRLDTAATDQGKTRLLRTIRDMAGDAGFFSHLLVRLAPIPTMVISYSMGAAGARVRPYLLAAAVAVIPQMLWVHSGSVATSIGTADSNVAQWTGVVVSVIMAILISILIPRAAMKRLAECSSSH